MGRGKEGGRERERRVLISAVATRRPPSTASATTTCQWDGCLVMCCTCVCKTRVSRGSHNTTCISEHRVMHIATRCVGVYRVGGWLASSCTVETIAHDLNHRLSPAGHSTLHCRRWNLINLSCLAYTVSFHGLGSSLVTWCTGPYRRTQTSLVHATTTLWSSGSSNSSFFCSPTASPDSRISWNAPVPMGAGTPRMMHSETPSMASSASLAAASNR